jgi:single-stranded DNA-binding protein
MQVTLSGRTGRVVQTNDVPRHDGSGSFQVAETSLAVNVTKDTSDWHKLKFVGDSLVTAASYIPKGAPVSVVGTLTFEHWTDEDGVLQSRPVVAVSEVQLPAKAAVAA